MERVKKLKNYFLSSFNRLKEAYQKAEQNIEKEEYTFYRDSAIQRFEFTFEIFWKMLRYFLLQKEGISVNSPKSVFRELFAIGKITEDETFLLLSMTDDRNLTVHTYHEEISEIIFKKLGKYIEIIEKISNSIN